LFLNSNFDQDGHLVFSFHENNYCLGPDLRHDWQGSHMEDNLFDPAAALMFSPDNSFVILAFIEQRFLSAGSHLTARDAHANPGLDMFDFAHSPSLDAAIPGAPLPLVADPGGPFP
jgi:hypothetical protein